MVVVSVRSLVERAACSTFTFPADLKSGLISALENVLPQTRDKEIIKTNIVFIDFMVFFLLFLLKNNFLE
jgi:hypothetical protein